MYKKPVRMGQRTRSWFPLDSRMLADGFIREQLSTRGEGHTLVAFSVVRVTQLSAVSGRAIMPSAPKSRTPWRSPPHLSCFFFFFTVNASTHPLDLWFPTSLSLGDPLTYYETLQGPRRPVLVPPPCTEHHRGPSPALGAPAATGLPLPEPEMELTGTRGVCVPHSLKGAGKPGKSH